MNTACNSKISSPRTEQNRPLLFGRKSHGVTCMHSLAAPRVVEGGFNPNFQVEGDVPRQ